MRANEELGLPLKGTYPAKVIEVINDFKVVINCGKLNRIRIDASPDLFNYKQANMIQ